MEKFFPQHENRYQRISSSPTTQSGKLFENLQLSKYEIAPCEPLHDLKGHTSNLIEELVASAPESTKPS